MNQIEILLGEIKDRLNEVEKLMNKPEPMKPEKFALKIVNRMQAKVVADYLGTLPTYPTYPFYTYNQNGCYFECDIDRLPAGYTEIDFEFWTAQKGVDVPEFIMVSEDGERLYFGDKFWHVVYIKRKWSINTSIGYDNNAFTFDQGNFNCHFVLTKPDHNKAFASRSAAEKWVEEQNMPKEVIIQVDHETRISVRPDGLEYLVAGVPCYSQRPNLIEKIYATFKELQQQSDKNTEK